MMKTENLKLVIKTFLQKVMFQIGLKKFLLLQKSKILFRGLMLLVILRTKKILERFTKKNCNKTNQKEFTVDKLIKRKGDKLYVKWKGYVSSLNSWTDKKMQQVVIHQNLLKRLI